MKKRKQTAQSSRNVEPKQEGISLGDLLQSDMAAKLKKLKQEKEQELQKLKEEEAARKAFEQKQREKNKSFEELLNESQMDWKKYK